MLDLLMGGSWLLLGAYSFWFFFKAKTFQPLTSDGLVSTWELHKQQTGCTASRIQSLLTKKDKVVGFKCDCGYEFLQKRLITQKVHTYAQPITVPLKSSKVAGLLQKTRGSLKNLDLHSSWVRTRNHVAWAAFGTLLATIVTSVVVDGLKILFGVPRPCLGLPYCPATYSFPSGHSAVAFAAATVLSLHFKNGRLTFFLSILACLVTLSRLMLNVHRIEDVVFGAIIGSVTGIIVQRGIIHALEASKNNRTTIHARGT